MSLEVEKHPCPQPLTRERMLELYRMWKSAGPKYAVMMDHDEFMSMLIELWGFRYPSKRIKRKK